MNLTAQMPTTKFNMNFNDIGDSSNMTLAEIEALEESIGWRMDVLEKVKVMLDLTNTMSIEADYSQIIANLQPDQRNMLFKAFILSSKVLSETLSVDGRNQKSVEILKVLAGADYSISLADQPVHAVKPVVDIYFKGQAAKIQTAIAELFDLIDAFKQKSAFTNAELAEILATAFSQQHKTLQQTFVRIMIMAMQQVIHAERSHPVEKDAEMLGIYAVISSLHDTLWLPLI